MLNKLSFKDDRDWIIIKKILTNAFGFSKLIELLVRQQIAELKNCQKSLKKLLTMKSKSANILNVRYKRTEP